MKGLLRRLGSLKLTVWILVALTIVFLSGMLIPQKTVLQRDLYLEWKESVPTLVSALDTLGLTSVYTSPVIIGLWVLFFVNLGLVMWRRVGTVRALIAVHPGKLRKIEAVRRGRPNVEIRVPRSADGTATVGRFFA